MGLQGEYEDAKRAYHSAGRKAKGTQKNSPERKAYRTAKSKYHRLGKQLRKR